MENQDIDSIIKEIMYDTDNFNANKLEKLSELLLKDIFYIIYNEGLLNTCVEIMTNKYDSQINQNLLYLIKFIDSIKEYEKKLEIKSLKIKNEMIKKLPEYFYNDECGNVSIYYVEPLRRECAMLYNFIDIDTQNRLYIDYKKTINNIKKMNKNNYISICRYVDKLTNKLNYSKSLLLKYELARNKTESKMFFDIFINEEFINYINCQYKFRIWLKELYNTSNVDGVFAYKNNNPNDYIYKYMRDIHNKEFNFVERLPVSVIEYVKYHPEHKDVIYKGRTICFS